MERFNREVHFENFEDDKFALGRTIAHEIGHSFGLSHNKEQSGCIEVDNDVQPILMDGGGRTVLQNKLEGLFDGPMFQ